VLSGLALRGWDVPYAAQRAPLTHLLCALFVPYERFLSPALLSVLLAATYLWISTRAGPVYAALALFALFCQNILLQTTIDISSELPAALLLLLGFYSLAVKRLWWSTLFFTCAVYARWNVLPIWVVVVMGVFLRYGLQQTTKFITVGVVLFGAWYVLSLRMGFANPLLTVYEGNYLPVTDWAPW
jgi:hypothetical protein